MWKRGRIKGRVIRRTSEDKVGNAFGFHANIILIPVSAVEPELGSGYGGVDAFDPDGDGRSSETKGQRANEEGGCRNGTEQRGAGVARVEPKRVIRETLFSL